jgi:undecaprenyl-diphosphatase
VITTVTVVLLFLCAAWVVRAATIGELDRGAKALIREGRSEVLETPMRVISALATGYVLLPIAIAASVLLWQRRHRGLALALPAIGVAAALALPVIKWMIAKPRPSLRGYGFPSGHVFAATVFVLVGLYLLWCFDAPRRWQRVAQVVGIAFVTLVGYSRIFVNAHWLSDVVGGLLAGAAFALVTVLALDRRLR